MQLLGQTPSMNVLVTGGTGFIGRALVERLVKEDHRVVLLSRRPRPLRTANQEIVQAAQWDGKTIGPLVRGLEGVDAVVNLAGESIGAKRWTRRRKVLLVDSRIEPTRTIVAAIGSGEKRPAVLVNASAVGYYGDVESGDVTETHPSGTDFLARVCERWEKEASRAEEYGIRVVRMRFGIVLETGGALKKMMVPFRLFVGGPLGSGRQWFPWIHRDDVVGAILFCLANPNISGPVNVTSPDVVTMSEFTHALGKAMHKPTWARVPAFVLRVLLGEMAETIISGQRVVSRKLQDAGYTFRYPKLDEALAAIVTRRVI
jgi:uncharacterized protein (TIGR01777 family)